MEERFCWLVDKRLILKVESWGFDVFKGRERTQILYLRDMAFL